MISFFQIRALRVSPNQMGTDRRRRDLPMCVATMICSFTMTNNAVEVGDSTICTTQAGKKKHFFGLWDQQTVTHLANAVEHLGAHRCFIDGEKKTRMVQLAMHLGVWFNLSFLKLKHPEVTTEGLFQWREYRIYEWPRLQFFIRDLFETKSRPRNGVH